jgi:nitroreductase
MNAGQNSNEMNQTSVGRDLRAQDLLLGYALLAPSCYNTQPWKFAAYEKEIKIFADEGRWLKVADVDQRELYISIGCALENLLIAAEHFGYGHQVSYSEDEMAVIVQIGFSGKPSTFRGQELFEAIKMRHTNRKRYQIRPIPSETLALLRDVCIEDGIMIKMADDAETKEKMSNLVLQANASMFSNPAFRKELGHWYGQGAFGSPLLISRICQMLNNQLNLGKLQAKKDSKAVMSASVLGIVSSKRNDKAAQILAGQVFERIWLKATALGISLQPMGQVLRVPDLKKEAASLFPSSDVCPQQIFRLGYAEPNQKRTARRPLTDFMI